MESEYVPKVDDRVYVLGQSGEFEVLNPDDDGQVLVRLIGTHSGVEHQSRFPRQAIKPIGAFSWKPEDTLELKPNIADITNGAVEVKVISIEG